METQEEQGVELPQDMPAEDRLFHQMTDGDFLDDTEDSSSTEDIDSSLASPEAAEDDISDEEGSSEGSDEDAVEDNTEALSADPAEDVEFVEFEIDDKLYEVPVELREHLMKSADYTQKTQVVAQERKTLEVAHQAVQNLEAQYKFAQEVQPQILKAQALEDQAEQLHQYLRDNVANLSHADIEQVRFAIEDANKERDSIVLEVQQKQQEQQQAQEQSHQELLDKGTEVLRSKFPNWGETQQKQVREFALSTGFTEAEISGVVDPRHVEVLYKASMYDALKDGAAPAVKALKKAPAMVKAQPRGEPMSKETKDKLALRKKLKSNKLDARQKRAAVAEDIGNRWG